MKTLNEMTAADLRVIAREKLMPGAWKATKAEMLAYLESIGYSQEPQNEPELTEEVESNSYISETEEASEPIQEPEKDNGWELIAKKQLCNAYEQIVGGCENALADGDMTREEFDRWLVEEALDEVYHEAITTEYGKDHCGGPAPAEMRFAGKEFCYNYLKKLFKRDGYKLQNAPELTRESKSIGLLDKKESVPEPILVQSESKLKKYAASVRDRKTKELKDIFGEAASREEFYLSLKDDYRVRFIVKPEKLAEAYEKYRIGHAKNLEIKKAKYARDKEEAKKMNMTVGEYRKWLRESAKSGK